MCHTYAVLQLHLLQINVLTEVQVKKNLFCCTHTLFIVFSFVLQPGLDLVHHFSQKGKTLQEKNAGALGPHVMVLSDSETSDIKVYAVVQGNMYYEAGSVFDAADICLKAAFVFGLSYPMPARSSWTFVQKAVFGISCGSDHSSTRLSEVITAVK